MSAVPEDSVISAVRLGQLRQAHEILTHEGQALTSLARRLDVRFCEAIELLTECRGSVIVSGIGKAGLIGRKITATLASTGTRSHFLHPTEALHGDLGCLSGDDLWLVLSNSGETEEILKLVPLIRERQLPIVAITASDASSLGAAADVVIPLGRLVEAGLHGLPPTTSTTAMLAIGDALALVVSQQREFTPQQFAAFHPGGSLGRRLTQVKDIMRSGEQVRIAPETSTIREIFVALSRPGRRSGAVMLIDAHGKLSGLFTDSDLARLLEQRRDQQFDRPIAEVMTVRPLTVGTEAILEEVLQVLGARQVSELPVVDRDGCPVGLVDITDLIGLG